MKKGKEEDEEYAIEKLFEFVEGVNKRIFPKQESENVSSAASKDTVIINRNNKRK